MKPFVLSEDAHMLLGGWANRKGFTIPNTAFFASLLGEMMTMLTKIFGEVVLAKELVISQQLTKWAQESRLPFVSMDGVYFQSLNTIQVSRAVDQFGNDAGLMPRFGTSTLQNQIKVLEEQKLHEIALVDDVVFSGHQMKFAIEELASAGILVKKVLAGVCVGAGEQLLKECGVEVSAVYLVKEVVDEICQRDFLPGVPRCGRFVVGSKNVGLPYLLPFGRPGDWASVPLRWQESFSRVCTKQAAQVFEMTEKLSGKPVLGRDIERKLPGMPEDLRFVEFLQNFL